MEYEEDLQVPPPPQLNGKSVLDPGYKAEAVHPRPRGALLIIHHRGKRNRRAAALRSKLITFGGTRLQLIIVSIHSISEMAKHTHGITSVILSASVAQPGKACIRFRSDVCVLEKVQGCTLLVRM
jgi:hypothetical protein